MIGSLLCLVGLALFWLGRWGARRRIRRYVQAGLLQLSVRDDRRLLQLDTLVGYDTWMGKVLLAGLIMIGLGTALAIVGLVVR